MIKLYKQTLKDKIISNYLNIYYNFIEKTKLKYLRSKNTYKFTNEDLISVYNISIVNN